MIINKDFMTSYFFCLSIKLSVIRLIINFMIKLHADIKILSYKITRRRYIISAYALPDHYLATILSKLHLSR